MRQNMCGVPVCITHIWSGSEWHDRDTSVTNCHPWDKKLSLAHIQHLSWRARARCAKRVMVTLETLTRLLREGVIRINYFHPEMQNRVILFRCHTTVTSPPPSFDFFVVLLRHYRVEIAFERVYFEAGISIEKSKRKISKINIADLKESKDWLPWRIHATPSPC